MQIKRFKFKKIIFMFSIRNIAWGDKVKHARISIVIVSIIVMLLLVSAYLYATGFFDKKKELVAVPPKHIDNLYYFYWGSYFDNNNSTPLTHYWLDEYYRLHTWTMQKDGLNLTIYPEHVIGDSKTESIYFVLKLNVSRYVEKVEYVSDATGMAKKNGGFLSTMIEEDNYADKKIAHGDVNWPGDPSVGEWDIYKFNMANFSFLCHIGVNDMKYTNASLPYNFTAYIGTQNKIYRMEFMFNITDEHYPYLEPEYNYTTGASYFNITGAKYFCYVNGNVVVSDHIVNGTQYYFIEKNGLLSKIEEMKK